MQRKGYVKTHKQAFIQVVNRWRQEVTVTLNNYYLQLLFYKHHKVNEIIKLKGDEY